MIRPEIHNIKNEIQKDEKQVFHATITRKNPGVTNDKITTYIVLSSKTSRCSIGGETGYLQGLAEDLLQIKRESNKPLLLGERQKAILGPQQFDYCLPTKEQNYCQSSPPLSPKDGEPAEYIPNQGYGSSPQVQLWRETLSQYQVRREVLG